MIRALLVGLALFPGLVGCQKSLDQVLQEHRPAVEAKLAEVAQLKAAVDAAPREASSSFQAPAEAVVLDPDEKNNAAVVHAEDLPSPGFEASATVRTIRARRLAECGSLLRSRTYLGGFSDAIPRVAASYLKACELVRYLFVVRTFDAELPSMSGKDKFTPGHFTGDVLLYEVATRKTFGGFKVSVTSSDTVNVYGANVDSDRIREDFQAKVFVAIDDGIRKLLPGALPPKT